MPYAKNQDLPKTVRNGLPAAAQTIWRSAFNDALRRNENDEENAARVAWSAVKQKYRQSSEGTWVRKNLSIEEVKAAVQLAQIPKWLRGRLLDDLNKGRRVEEDFNLTIEDLEKREFSTDERRRMASQGSALSDGSYPIANCSDVSNAVKAFGRASEEKRGQVKAHILRRAKALGCSDDVPDDWKSSASKAEEAQEQFAMSVSVAEGTDATYSVVKADDELRYTLGPVYSPGVLDAHEEMIEAGDLQKSLWDYVRKGDRTIRLQHTAKRAGEWVEVVTWPTDIKMATTKADDSSSEIEFPAGTVFMGVIWDEGIWPAVKSGKITGYSLGGRGRREAIDEGG